MAIHLEANYSKKLGLPGCSSHQYSVTIKTEVIDPNQVHLPTLGHKHPELHRHPITPFSDNSPGICLSTSPHRLTCNKRAESQCQEVQGFPCRGLGGLEPNMLITLQPTSGSRDPPVQERSTIHAPDLPCYTLRKDYSRAAPL